ncbi:S-adenosyl-L-methionine-dependent methyltransferase [Hypoxylon rubiginosum]|uniref:S-adenosyl-L-methionine-dependent methyltransferase n=1 Tax=Hypoxylon rubiginosum TaxID=110542 RepID=A0ACC0D1L0_9PEZI|nr:S-adenosyl-L-methionine-dependent methyltransferase [Hypoxylon rubiginosum]
MSNSAETQTAFMPKRCFPRTSRLLGSMIGESTISVARHYLTELIPPIAPGAVIHDNGCGTGAVTRAVLELYPELLASPTKTTIHATDINPSFIDDFREYVVSQGWKDTVQPATMPAEDLSLQDSTLTHSFTNFVIFGTRDPARAAAQAYRTLATGGVAVMTTWAILPHTKALDRTREKLYGEHGMAHIRPEWSSPAHLEDLLKAAGFGRVESRQADSVLEYGNLEGWIEIAWSWMGMPRGGWTEREEREWDRDMEVFKQECLREGFEVMEDGRLRVKMVANVVVAWKDK